MRKVNDSEQELKILSDKFQRHRLGVGSQYTARVMCQRAGPGCERVGEVTNPPSLSITSTLFDDAGSALYDKGWRVFLYLGQQMIFCRTCALDATPPKIDPPPVDVLRVTALGTCGSRSVGERTGE